MRLTVSYPSDTPSVMVVDPTDAQIAAADVATIGNETTATYEVPSPVPGEWRICGIRHVGALIEYLVDSAAVVDGYRLSASSEKMSSAADGKRIYRVTAYLCKEAAINAANVSGVLYHDGAEVGTFVFANPANGTYTTYVTLDGEPKTYSLYVTADNASGKAYETFKDIIYEGGEPPDDKPLGENFQRTTSVTFADEEVMDGEIVYVSAANGDDSRDGATWATAKRTIQAAVDAVAKNGTVIVTNGTYAPFVTHDKRLTIRSVEGWEKTTIDGGGTTRCADLGESSYQTDSHLIGFRLVNGEAGAEGGGGARGGKLIRCRIEQCHAATGGGALHSILENSVVASNAAETTGGGAQDCSLRGCTVAQNQSKSSEGGQGGGVYDCGAINTIIWGNKNGAGSVDNCAESSVKHSCTTPAQDGDGNIAGDPLFANAANGDFSLKAASPCRDAGHSGFVDDLVDAAGQPRVMGDEVDIGAYEAKVLPAAPVNVVASDGLSMQHVSVSWDAGPDAKTYAVWRTDGTEETCLASGLAVTYFLDWTAVPGVHYQYSVRASNDSGEGVASETDEGWVAVMLLNSVVASDGTSSEAVVVTWKCVADAATYQIWRSTDDNIENARQIGTSEGASYSDATAISGKVYYYWVRPVVGSQEEQFVGPDSGFRKMRAPREVSASQDRTDGVLVKWWLVDDARKYLVYRSTWSWDPVGAELVGEKVYSLTGSGANIGTYDVEFVDTTAEIGVSYYYSIKAVGEGKPSDFSSSAEGWRKPEAVTGVKATDGDFKNGIAVTWNPVEGATEYMLYRSQDPSFATASYVTRCERCVCYDTAVAGGTTYYYWVVSSTYGREGDPSVPDTGWSRGRITGNMSYIVIDLSDGPSAKRFRYSEQWSVGDVNAREYKTDKLVLRRIDPGSFLMGSPSNEVGRVKSAETGYKIAERGFIDADRAQQNVTISKPYYMGVFEVTCRQWANVGAPGGPPCTSTTETWPAYQVQYVYARSTIGNVLPGTLVGLLRSKTGLGAAIDLPTEAQWEYACRAGTTTALNNGCNLARADATEDFNLSLVARYAGNGGSGQSGVAEVGSYDPNAWGLYDMHGNVAEWCADQFMHDRWGCAHLRGGGHESAPRHCRSASRIGLKLDGVLAVSHGGNASGYSGVRLALNVDALDSGAGDPAFLIDHGELVACEPNGKKDVVIPSTVKRIGASAFRGCPDVRSVTIPNSVTSICYEAFGYCEGLQRISIPDSVKTIEAYAFCGCTGLVEVAIGSGLEVIGAWPLHSEEPGREHFGLTGAFSYCPALKRFVVSAKNRTFKSVGGMLLSKDGKTFLACPEGKTGAVVVPDGVTRVLMYAFEGCYGLTSLTLPDSLVAFGCGFDLYDLCDGNTIPGVLLVDGWAVGVDYPGPTGELDLAGIRGISDNAFAGCGDLTGVTIPEGVKSIGGWAFSDCSSLTRVSIPDSVEYVSEEAFDACNDSLYDYDGVPGAVLVDGWVMGSSPSGGGFLDLSEARGIADGAFADDWTLKGVVLPRRLKRIDNRAFDMCVFLESVDIPEGVVSIGDHAFDCTDLLSVTIPASVREIGDVAFGSCSLTNIVFEGNAPALGLDSFVTFGRVVVQVHHGSTGWGVSIPGRWNGMRIEYIEKSRVTFDATGGAGGMTLDVPYGSPVGSLPAPTRTGYTFDGWWTAETGGLEISASTTVYGDVTYYAHWVANTYVVTFDACGGHGTMPLQKFKAGKEQPLMPNAFACAGHVLAGWATNATGNVVFADGQSITVYADLTLYAVWTASSFSPQYLVVDLSGGPDAATYPVVAMDSEPFCGFNTYEYKTKKLVLRKIPAGSFVMGSEPTEVGYTGNEAVPHRVTISKPFYAGLFEVTQKQYELVTGLTPSLFSSMLGHETRPVDQVSWNDIRGYNRTYNWPGTSDVDPASFMGKLRAKAKIDTFDLPTEAQWEYACRAGTTNALNSGKDLLDPTRDSNMAEVGRYLYNGSEDVGAAEVGSYSPNQWGLYDMHGNAWEWCLDWWQDGGSFPSAEQEDPVGPEDGTYRVVRSGNWSKTARHGRSAYRTHAYASDTTDIGSGFRLVCAMVECARHTVSFEANGGNGFMPVQTFVEGAERALRRNAFARVGHTFGGWATNATGDVVYADGQCINVTEDAVLYAVWMPPSTRRIVGIPLNEQPGAKGTVTMSPKNGDVEAGGTVTLTAKAGNKNTVFAYWTDGDGNIVGYTATLKVKPEGDMTYKAVFRLKSVCERPVFECGDIFYDGYPSRNSMVGVAYKAQVVVDEAAYPVKFSATGLPAGLKIDATAGIISGVPTKAGTFQPTITVKSAANAKLKASSRKIAIKIAKLPAWAYGSFSGPICLGDGDFSDPEGQVTLSVGSTGKISGKFTVHGTNWTVSISSYSAESESDGGLLIASGTATRKVGTKTYKMPCTWQLEEPDADDGRFGMGELNGGEYEFFVLRNNWKDANPAALLKDWVGIYDWLAPDGAKLALTVGGGGIVKVTGSLGNGRKLTLSTPLLMEYEGMEYVLIYAPPATVVTKTRRGRVVSTVSYPEFVAYVRLRNVPGTPVPGGEFAYRRQGVRPEALSLYGESPGSGTFKFSPAYGQAAENATVTVTAVPAKDSVFAYWMLGDDIVGYGASYKVKMGDGDFTGLSAVFRKKSVFTAKPERPFVVMQEGAGGEEVNPFASLRVGVAFRAEIEIDPDCRPVKFAAKNLPAGLKLNATTGVISGVPTAAGTKVASITATSVANPKLVSPALKVSMPTVKLDAWAKGTYTGKGTLAGKAATLTLTVGAAGKVSGKFTVAKKSYSFSASSYATYRDGVYKATSKVKYGSVTYSVSIAVKRDEETKKGTAEIEVLNGAAVAGSVNAVRK